jgi:DGQHR domain-containing protein
MTDIIKTNAITVKQNSDIPLFSFFLKGKDILKIADISRLRKNKEGALLGYQRGEVLNHINEIVTFLDSEKILFPNAIILAMTSDIKFKKNTDMSVENSDSDLGILEIPIKKNSLKPAWIVDGQQRTMALSKCNNPDILVPVIGFVSDDIEVHRSQFLLINKVKPLPSGLINELLPSIKTVLPASLVRNQIPSTICDILCSDSKSPFFGLIRRTSTSNEIKKTHVITDSSLLQTIRNSLSSVHGCLYQYRNIANNEVDIENCIKVINLYWGEVKKIFPEAWGKDTRSSRLMHGVGIKAMGNLMDRVMNNIHLNHPNAKNDIHNTIVPLRDYCAWTEGTWKFMNNIPWNQLQNTPRDVKLLSNYLIRLYAGIELT